MGETSRRRGRTGAVVVGVAVLAVATGCGPYGSDSASEERDQRRREGTRRSLNMLWSAFEAGTPGPFVATFADDVQLHSPALMSPDYRGRDLVTSIVTPAMQVLEGVRVSDVLEAADGTGGTVVFEARVGAEPVQGVVLLRTRGDRVSEVTLMLRPLAALRAFVARMAELGAKPAVDAAKR